MKKIIFFLFAIPALFAKESGIERLVNGNQRYMNDMMEHPNHGTDRRQAIVSKQKPFAVILGCSDSRVAPEIIFDQGVGDLFVVRVAGNVISPVVLASIEYAVVHLHSSTVLVLGHENCGAVKAVVQGQTKDIEPIAELINPAVQEEKKRKAPDLLEASIKTNALRMRDLLLKNPVIQKYVAEKNLKVYASYYNLKSGAVELLQP